MNEITRGVNAIIQRLKSEGGLETGNISDTYHTFDELYDHRTKLFAAISNMFPDNAWKSRQHHDPDFPMYDGMFIAGIDTPYGQATYHCEYQYWDDFKVKELDRAPEFDGHTPEQALERIFKMATDFHSLLDGQDEEMSETCTFSEALEAVKNGARIWRKNWNGKGQFVVYQKGYPDGIPCNKQTAEAWGMQEGDLFKCGPYLQIQTNYGMHNMWVPSISDLLSDDWVIDNRS